MARLSIVIPTLNAAQHLPACLDALLPGLEIGLIREVLVADGGSGDDTCALAEVAGARVIGCKAGRGGQLAAGGREARGDWLLFLHADTVLGADWAAAAAQHMQAETDAAVFRLAFRASGAAAVIVAAWANLRTRLFRLPYGDQGLLISRALYERVGGFSEIPLMEDVAMARALRGRFRLLPVRAETGADRYLAEGWVRRGGRNLLTLARFLGGTDPEALARSYQRR